MFLEVNNGRVLTLYDLGRFDFSIRMGLAKALRQKKWGLVVAGSTVRYRRRIRMFEKVTIYTQVAGYEERWIYIVQSMWAKGEPASSILLRTGITNRGKVVPARDVIDALGIEDWNPVLHPWVKEWIQSEESRLWPPPKDRLTVAE
jgi:acyl-CoA thioesterase FadM